MSCDFSVVWSFVSCRELPILRGATTKHNKNREYITLHSTFLTIIIGIKNGKKFHLDKSLENEYKGKNHCILFSLNVYFVTFRFLFRIYNANHGVCSRNISIIYDKLNQI